ncbi:CopG family transcriptional regulator [Cyanobium sp. CH-040]|uniref:ribbon-helix-helix domain-containing protein n=1 Tax=Cyanobium sp. CH-040 TaxID=2823708 RepID=UPI0020CED74E|nr:CopG family transcriptional regulator [Cyanobium sp. CH-040]MCP9926751.1 ribbon-helix-helix protein, CopG family [Cyanobium sp. CH-040]
MRTTLTLDDDLAEALSRSARLSGRSFKDVVNAAIRRGLAAGEHPADGGREPFVVQPQACGLMPGIDPLRLNQLVDQLEAEQFMAAQMPAGPER